MSLITGMYQVVFQRTALTLESPPPSTPVAPSPRIKALALVPDSNQLYRWKMLLEEQVLTPLNASDDPNKVLEALHEAFTILEMLIVGVSLSGSALQSRGESSASGPIQLTKKGSFMNYLHRHRRTLMLAMLVCVFVVVPLESVLSLVVIGLFLWVPVWSPLITIVRHTSEGKASLLGHWLLSLDRAPHRAATTTAPLPLTVSDSSGVDPPHGNLLPLSLTFQHQSGRGEDAVVCMLSTLGGDAPTLSLSILSGKEGGDPQLLGSSSAVAKLNLARVMNAKGGGSISRGVSVPLQYAATPLEVAKGSSFRLQVSIYPSVGPGTTAQAILEGGLDCHSISFINEQLCCRRMTPTILCKPQRCRGVRGSSNEGVRQR
jgi:hypothetical protein